MVQTEETRPMMYKEHYTTPFRDSEFNIRPKDKMPEHPQTYTSYEVWADLKLRDWDMNDPDMAQVAKNPLLQEKHILMDEFDESDPEAMAAKCREVFEARP